MMQTPDRHLWISRSEGVWTIDPAHIARNPVAPIVSIEDLSCNGTHYDVGSSVTLASGSRNLQIGYTAALLTHPERVRFRYRLLGVDEGWQEAGQRRQAYYTNLSPGPYEFQIMAANEDGVWSRSSAVLKFKVVPAFYQRLGFKIVAGIVVLSLLALAFFMRLGQLHRRYRREVEMRHAERERIARDLHDTLLQGAQALLFRVHMWEEERGVPESLRAEMAAVSHQTKAMIIEGRERIVKMRRSDANPADLVDSLTVMGSESAVEEGPKFEVRVTGDPRILTVDTKEQLLDIAREAVRNAYQHAAAARVEVHLEYRKRSLIMRITDNGQGFNCDAAARRGESRHFGMKGMRERAQQLGAEFRIHSEIDFGTRIEVIVPARVAFRDTLWKWWWTT
jgi:signal transduction histidine kinase